MQEMLTLNRREQVRLQVLNEVVHLTQRQAAARQASHQLHSCSLLTFRSYP